MYCYMNCKLTVVKYMFFPDFKMLLVRNNNFSSGKNYLVAIDFLDSIHSKTKNEHSLVKDPISRLLKIKAL